MRICNRKDLHDKTGVRDSKKIKDFSPEQFEVLWKTVEKWEGYDKEGTIITRKIVEMSRIAHVHKDKNGAISEYCVDGQGWVSKEEALELANQKKLDVEFCASKLGSIYLRVRAHSSFQRDFDDIIEKGHES